MPITRPKERTLPGSPTDRRPEIFPGAPATSAPDFLCPILPRGTALCPSRTAFFFPHGSAFPQYSPNLPFRRFIVGDPPPPLLPPTDSDLFFVSRETAFRPAIFPCGSPRLTGFLLRQNARATMECAVYPRFARINRQKKRARRLSSEIGYYSMEMRFSALSSSLYLGTTTVRMPFSYFALMESSLMPSPT